MPTIINSQTLLKMPTTSPQLTTKPLWGNAFAAPASEFPQTQLKVLAGTIPAGLAGTLYRNGPGRLERAGKRVGIAVERQ